MDTERLLVLGFSGSVRPETFLIHPIHWYLQKEEDNHHNLNCLLLPGPVLETPQAPRFLCRGHLLTSVETPLLMPSLRRRFLRLGPLIFPLIRSGMIRIGYRCFYFMVPLTDHTGTCGLPINNFQEFPAVFLGIIVEGSPPHLFLLNNLKWSLLRSRRLQLIRR